MHTSRSLNAPRLLLSLSLSTLSLSPIALAQPARSVPAPKPSIAPLNDRIADRVKKEMNDYGLVGVSVGLVKGGNVIFSGGWGWEDRVRHIPVSDVTAYDWASCSKTMTAVVALQLWSEGKIDLDKDVRDYVSEWPVKNWQSDTAKLTPRELLSHQSGLPHSPPASKTPPANPDGAEHPLLDVVSALRQFSDAPLQFKPGSKFSYSNCGFLLLGAVEQKAAGTPYDQLVHDRIAERLGMTSLRPDYSWERPPHQSVGYTPGGKKEAVKPDSDVRLNLPAGAWSSTVTDFARYAAGFMGERILDEHMKRAMWDNQKTGDGKTTPVGLGIFVGGKKRNHLVLNHSGASPITSTFMLILPSDTPGEGVAAVIMCNTAGAKLGRLANDLIAMIGGDGTDADWSDRSDDNQP